MILTKTQQQGMIGQGVTKGGGEKESFCIDRNRFIKGYAEYRSN